MISLQSRNRNFSSVDDLANSKVGLLLGTAPNTLSGQENTFFHNRILAAVELYQKGKVKYILASGDNASIYYNEPIYMKEELIRQGISSEHIVLDYAGFSTLDSIIRAKEIFGQSSFIIISQRFQNERALYIAHWKGINAVAYNANPVKGYAGLMLHIRELFARVKALVDVHLLHTQPKFLGDPEPIS